MRDEFIDERNYARRGIPVDMECYVRRNTRKPETLLEKGYKRHTVENLLYGAKYGSSKSYIPVEFSHHKFYGTMKLMNNIAGRSFLGLIIID